MKQLIAHVAWETDPKWYEKLAHDFLAQSQCLHMPLRISRSLAMAEFSMKSFALFMR